MAVVNRQLALGLPRVRGAWGGRREGAGRKPTGKVYVAHRTRPYHERRLPLHVTYRVVRGVGSLREKDVAAAIVGAIARGHKRTFRVCQFSIQSDHIHLVTEAGSKSSLSRGMQGLAIAMARAVNRVLGRRGRVFVERYHARELASPRDVRNVLRYVLLNRMKHVGTRRGEWIADECTSGPWFDGWAWNPHDPRAHRKAPIATATTWLLRSGWKRGGRWIDPRETPGLGATRSAGGAA